jgi:hypothetical protein
LHWSSKPWWIAWQGQKNQSKHQSSGSCREQSFCTNLAEVLKDRVLANNDIEWQFYIVFSPLVILLNRNFAMFRSSGIHIWELSLSMTNWTSHFCAQNSAYLFEFSFQALHTKLFFKVFDL